MPADSENQKSELDALQNSAREALVRAAAEQARREAAEQAAREAQAKAAGERAKREAAEQRAQEALVQASADYSLREAAIRQAREAESAAAAERAARAAADQSLHEAAKRAAQDRAEREAAVKAARDAAAAAAAERIAREAAEKVAIDATTKAEFERAARQDAEKLLKEADARAARQPDVASSPGPVVGPSAGLTSASRAGQGLVPAQSTALPPQSVGPSQQSIAASPPSSAKQQQVAQMPAWLVPLLTFVSAALLFVIISSVWTSWENDVSVKTDDAYVRADVAPLSTKASGIVQTTRVSDFQAVKKGQILVELKSLEYRARVEQAREAIHQVEIKLADMKQRKEQQDARVAEARASLENSRTSVTQVDDTISSATATIEEAKAGIEAARAAIDQSIAAITAAAADVTKTVLERHRQEALLAEESTTKEKVEQVVDEHERTVANLAAQKAAQAKARAELVARQALLEKASQELARSRAEKKKSLMLVQTHEHELTAQIKQRDLLDGEEKQLISELAAKKAGLTAAQVDLDYTIVRAPVDGVVGEVKVKPGQLVSAGTHVVTLISAKPWVIANYRETQLAKVREGDEATVEIDALPGRHLKGHVERIAPASGAQFSLLPPDNASGNFTKIIQRIPVKISFDDAADNLSDLRPGMSAIATIKPETSGRH